MAEAPSTNRSPLAETTSRVVNSSTTARRDHGTKTRADPANTDQQHRAVHKQRTQNTTATAGVDVRVTSPSDELDAKLEGSQRPASSSRPTPAAEESNRHSQTSHPSTASSREYKSHIGPWQLGKTLGQGSSAHVRLCRHNVTNQLAAVKIVNRRMAYMVQDSSMAALNKWDKNLPEQINGEMRVPMAIEREVAILKLIEHPHIMKLYDIWENRSEIYLILEYIDQGDLFTFINSRGRLTEEISLYFFRQMISAITYCHSFNICHRDLKPENILITADMQIKIADFGMAALHQTDTHQLATACGSPHYAAPELLKSKQYRGDKADIWSMGVILYAMLSATLPFDDPDLRVLMGKTKKGRYEMPQGLSLEAEDLIRCMLQTNPDRRISLKEIWQHPLVQKYSYLDKLGNNNGQPPDTRKGFQYAPVPRQNLDPQLLRQLRSMWHMFSDQDLALKLTCDEPNDQKAFYWLLHNYRDKQLEDFKPEIAHSMSDYHHLKPGAWKKRVSTCEFSQVRSNGHGRSVSRFTVISNAADNEGNTRQSKEAKRSSRQYQSAQASSNQTGVNVQSQRQTVAKDEHHTALKRSNSNARTVRRSSVRSSVHAKPASNRGSMTSLRSNRQGATHVHRSSLRQKRAVNFSHVRKRSSSTNPTRRNSRKAEPTVTTTIVVEPPKTEPSTPSTELSRPAIGKHAKAKAIPRPATAPKDAAVALREELRHFSSNIAKDCDEAFASSLIEDGSSIALSDRKSREASPLSFNFDPASPSTPDTAVSDQPWNTRPLPPLPNQKALSSHPVNPSDYSQTSVRGVIPHQVERHEGHVAEAQVMHIDRRVVSEPVYIHAQHIKPTALPAINENGATVPTGSDKARIVSAPPNTPPRRRYELNRDLERLRHAERTIRIVHSPTARGQGKIPVPLDVRKKNTAEDARQSLHRQLVEHAEAEERALDSASQASRDGTVKGKTSWFKRGSKTDADSQAQAKLGGHIAPSAGVSAVTLESEQDGSQISTGKKSFTFSFWKHDKKKSPKMSIDQPDEADEIRQSGHGHPKVLQKKPPTTWRDSRSSSSRHIDVKQNWLARLFRVKPAVTYLCLDMSRRRARLEIAILLREWRRYGIRGVTVDKQRSIVYARVASRNYLNLKEVEFAAEIMSVIEHGKKQPMCIVRISQERGAASSFNRVAQTIKTVFENRNMVVADKNTRKMMIKTLTAHETTG